MNSYTLNVPSSRKPEDWFSFIKESLTQTLNVNHLIVDFNNIDFLETDDFVVLACLIESFCLNDCTVIFLGGTQKLNNHLLNVKFKEYWEEGFDRNVFTTSNNDSTLCLWKISTEGAFAYSTFAREYFNKFAKNKDLIPLGTNLAEVFNNIFDHSKSPVSGYIITQYYPKNQKLSFSVCDFGIGIPTSINLSTLANDIKFKDDIALLRSLDQGFSSQSTPRNRGLGLNYILNFIDKSRGKLLMISNNGFLTKNAKQKADTYLTNFDFVGTLIKVEVDLRALEEIDENDVMLDF